LAGWCGRGGALWFPPIPMYNPTKGKTMQQILLVLIAILPVHAEAMDKRTDSFEICMQKVLHQQPGQVIKVEKKHESGRMMYEFDVRGEDGLDWDIECVQDTAEIWEVEREVQNPNDPLFKSRVSVGERAAREIALKAYLGFIREVEYEVESDGTAVYEFDIDMADGREMKVEINASSGHIHEANQEIWQIGLE
ncbi:MAG: PepSY domain-containing protein, partial [Methylophaga sp.]|nr:PepSY domain-containing protein [Methylophaga sp.]